MSSPKTIISGGQRPSEPPTLDAVTTRRVRLVVLDETDPYPVEDAGPPRRPGVRSARDKARFTGERHR